MRYRIIWQTRRNSTASTWRQSDSMTGDDGLLDEQLADCIELNTALGWPKHRLTIIPLP